jgi:AraC-like DNA-binding protein
MIFLPDYSRNLGQLSNMGGDLETETATKHAMHFGFGSMVQFAFDYRKAFGESPSETLKH